MSSRPSLSLILTVNLSLDHIVILRVFNFIIGRLLGKSCEFILSHSSLGMSSLDLSELRIVHLVAINKEVIIDSNRGVNHEINIGHVLQLDTVDLLQILLLKFYSNNFTLEPVKKSAYC